MQVEKRDNMYKEYFNKKNFNQLLDYLGDFIQIVTVIMVPFSAGIILLKLFGLLPGVPWLAVCMPLLVYYAIFTCCLSFVAISSKIIEFYHKRELKKCQASLQDNK